MTYRCSFNTPPPPHGRRGERFVVETAEGRRQASGRLFAGEVIVEAGHLPTEAVAAELAKRAKDPSEAAATEPPKPKRKAKTSGRKRGK